MSDVGFWVAFAAGAVGFAALACPFPMIWRAGRRSSVGRVLVWMLGGFLLICGVIAPIVSARFAESSEALPLVFFAWLGVAVLLLGISIGDRDPGWQWRRGFAVSVVVGLAASTVLEIAVRGPFGLVGNLLVAVVVVLAAVGIAYAAFAKFLTERG